MREIKFRAYNKITAEMKYNIPLSVSGDYGLDDVFRLIGSEENKVSLMQYTGFKDKNGKEIYEGDIVEYYDRDWKVMYDMEFGGYMLVRPGDSYENFQYDANQRMEVIGNIYENPELI